ncbi:MAG: hypothetical protein MJE77_40875 [Proteobacteria bacterium]|nr:hypothetical protein [Pseudomonadota bacterium]
MKRPARSGKARQHKSKQRGARRRRKQAQRQQHRQSHRGNKVRSVGNRASRVAIVDYAEHVVQLINRPIDSWAVAATLESQGLRDGDAQERWGYDDLFSFADDVYAEILTRAIPAKEQPALQKRKFHLARFARYMFEGSFFAMPMLGQIICLILTRYSLWASLNFSEEQATSVGLGTLASFPISGAPVMSIGRQGTVYHGLRAHGMLRRSVVELCSVGLTLTASVLLIVCLSQLFLPFVGFGSFLLTAAYFTTLCLLWLSLGALYMLRMHSWNVALTVAGAGLVAVLCRLFGIDVHLAQLVSITSCAAVAGAVAWRRMTRPSQQNQRHQHLKADCRGQGRLPRPRPTTR